MLLAMTVFSDSSLWLASNETGREGLILRARLFVFRPLRSWLLANGNGPSDT
jgi:hypothetical protein